jgi:hypothetical protein
MILLCTDSLYANTPEQTIDLIIFSFDRPLQLHTLLTSIKTYVTNLGSIFILCRASNKKYEQAYQEVHALFPDVQFVMQSNEPKRDFKPLLKQCFSATQGKYIMFATDDDLVKDYVDIKQCIEKLEQTQAYGFYLRLGNHITYSYIQDIQLMIPSMQQLTNDIVIFSFKNGKSFWGYPHNVDMTIYKKSFVEKYVYDVDYTSPNVFESRWASKANLNVTGLCFKNSKILNIPLNLVQQDWNNKNTAQYSPQELLDKWNMGLSIDIKPYHQIRNSSALMPYIINFIKRK